MSVLFSLVWTFLTFLLFSQHLQIDMICSCSSFLTRNRLVFTRFLMIWLLSLLYAWNIVFLGVCLSVSRSTGAHLRSEFRRGLLNLGNTCYINSVVQGMLSIGVFVQSIFRTPVKTKGSASMECMKLFAFLHESARSAINPQTFVNTCRPPWFTPGTQQVCLLNCLTWIL